MDENSGTRELSIILPCRNEEQALGFCLQEIKKIISENNIDAEIIVSDSSVDSSPQIARDHGVFLVKHDMVGYGRAYLEGFKKANGKYLFLADADATYDFSEIPTFLKHLRDGYDFVIGDRFKGKMDKGAMPWAHKYIGNPILSGILRMFFRSKVSDVHCGMRALTKESLDKLDLHSTGMEFASEMVLKAAKNKLKIKETPIDYRLRKGQSKLNPLADGWRHLRFMLLYSPLFLFFLPGVFLFSLGVLGTFLIYFDLDFLLGRSFDYHPLFFTLSLVFIGYQVIFFAVFAKIYAMEHLGEENKIIRKIQQSITIEKAGVLGFLIVVVGAYIYGSIFYSWVVSGYGELQEIKRSLLALGFLILGIQTIFSAFALSILGIKEK